MLWEGTLSVASRASFGQCDDPGRIDLGFEESTIAVLGVFVILVLVEELLTADLDLLDRLVASLVQLLLELDEWALLDWQAFALEAACELVGLAHSHLGLHHRPGWVVEGLLRLLARPSRLDCLQIHVLDCL